MMVNWTEIRNWCQFLVVVGGGLVALRTYLAGQRQRKLEHGLRLAAAFKAAVSDADITAWRTVIEESNRPPYAMDILTGTPGRGYPFGQLLRGDGPDNGAAARILRELDWLSHEFLAGYADLRVFYFEFGEVIESIYKAYERVDWVQAAYKTRCILDLFYPTFALLYRENRVRFQRWPARSLIHL